MQQIWALDMRAGVKTKTDHDEYCHEIRVMSYRSSNMGNILNMNGMFALMSLLPE